MIPSRQNPQVSNAKMFMQVIIVILTILIKILPIIIFMSIGDWLDIYLLYFSLFGNNLEIYYG